MWDRCHWRLLYNVAQNDTTTISHLLSFVRGNEVLELLEAMNINEAIYKFATHCGSWDWGLIAIVLVSGMDIEIMCNF